MFLKFLIFYHVDEEIQTRKIQNNLYNFEFSCSEFPRCTIREREYQNYFCRCLPCFYIFSAPGLLYEENIHIICLMYSKVDFFFLRKNKNPTFGGDVIFHSVMSRVTSLVIIVIIPTFLL